MNTKQETCDVCGQPAAYRVDGSPLGEARCEPCAIRYGYETRGDAYTAMKMLGCVIDLLRDAGLDDGAIAGMVQTTLACPHSTATYSFGADGFLPGPDRIADRPWMVGLTPLEAA